MDLDQLEAGYQSSLTSTATSLDALEANFQASQGGSSQSSSAAAPSLRNEILSVGNRFIDGAIDLGAATARGAMPALTPFFDSVGVDLVPDETARDVLEVAQVYGDEKAQTMPGRIAGEVAYQAPGVMLPGGSFATRTKAALGAGLGAGVSKEITDNPLIQLAATLFGGATPAATNATARGIARARNSAAGTLSDSADALRERALGIQYGDRTKGLNRAPMFVDDAGNLVDDINQATGVEAPIQQQLNLVLSKGFLDKAPNDPAALKVFLAEQKRGVGSEIRALAKEADSVVGKDELLPDFKEAQAFIANQRASKRPALQEALDDVISDYISEPGSGLSKLMGFKDKVGREMKFDQLTDQNKTLLMRRIYRDFQKLGEDVFDAALPENAGLFRELNKTYEALENLGRTTNKAVARKSPSLLGVIQGGSKPALALGGAASALTGDVGSGVALAGAGLLAKGALELGEQSAPMTMSRAYDRAARALQTEAPEALGAGVNARNIGVPALFSDLFGARRSNVSEQEPSVDQEDRRQRPPQESESLSTANKGQRPNIETQPTKTPISYENDSLAADLFTTADLRGGNVDAQTLEAFQSKVVDIADDLGADPRDLMAVMRFETGGTLNPAEKNRAGSGATGLIQFMPSTAKELTGAESKEAAIKLMESMSPVEQLDYVQKYLAPFKGRLNSLEDVYMAVLWPKAVGKDPDYALFERGTKAYWQNRGLDLNKDGVITKAEATSKVRSFNDRKGMVEA